MIYTHTRIFLPPDAQNYRSKLKLLFFFSVSEDKIFFVSSLEEAGQVAKID